MVQRSIHVCLLDTLSPDFAMTHTLYGSCEHDFYTLDREQTVSGTRPPKVPERQHERCRQRRQPDWDTARTRAATMGETASCIRYDTLISYTRRLDANLTSTRTAPMHKGFTHLHRDVRYDYLASASEHQRQIYSTSHYS